MDLIDRQAAIDAVQNRHMMLSKEKVLLVNDLEKLPYAEPDVPDINVGDKDTISRKAAIDALNKLSESTYEVNYGVVDCDDAIGEIKQLPPTQPERIRGRWVYTGVKFPNWEGQIVSEAICSKCNGISYFRRAFDKFIGANFCPNCGSDNRGVTE